MPGVTAILYLTGRASCSAETHSVGHGTILRLDVVGRDTEVALHGFLAMRSSSTAAAKIADTFEKMTRR